jgi:Ca2+-binding RTX toxin-like protein
MVVADRSALGGDGALIEVNHYTGTQRPLSYNAISSPGLFKDPTGVALDRQGRLLVADPEAFGGSGGVIRVDPSTGQQTGLSSNAISSQGLFKDPVGIAVTASGSLLVADPGASGGRGAVIAVDPANGQQSLVSDNLVSSPGLFANPSGIAVERDGTILVADPDSPAPASGTDGAIIAVDPVTGAQRLVTNNDASQADLFGDPLGIAIETPGTLLVANASPTPAANGVVLVNRSSGQQYGLATEGMFTTPTGIAEDLDGRAVVADSGAFGGTGGVIRVDPATGTQVAISGNPNSPGALFVDPTGILVTPPTCLGRYATIVGTEGADVLTGTPGSDVIAGRGGNDIIDGEGGSDVICGAGGRDRLMGRDGRDRFLAGNGADLIRAGNGADRCKGQGGSDEIDGGRGNDRLYGARNRDDLAGGKGRDLLDGGPGRDRLRGGPGRDRLNGGPGRDRLQQ